MIGLDYNRLMGITKSEKPYRGTTDRFPIGNRKHNTKDFIVDTLDGETVFRVRYGFQGKYSYITKEEYNSAIQAGEQGCYENTYEDDPALRYYRHAYAPRELGVVRPDNTFEFTMDGDGGQGANTIMSGWSRGIFFRSIRHGGMVYREGHGYNHGQAVRRFHAVFKGLRVHTDDMRCHESSAYTVVTRQVDRSKTKEFLKPYEDFFKVTETMSKAMESKGIIETTVEILDEVKHSRDSWWLDEKEKKRLLAFAESYMKDRPIDAMLMFCVAHNINDLRRYTRERSSIHGYTYYSDLESLYTNFRRRMGKELYARSPDVFAQVEHMGGAPYPQSSWDVTILCNGKEVEQY